MRFSQRISKKPIRTTIQVESIDQILLTKIWNFVYVEYLKDLPFYTTEVGDERETFFSVLWHEFFELPVDKIPTDTDKVIQEIRNWFFAAQWYEIYDFIEFLIRVEKKDRRARAINLFNSVLEQEMAGYRFVGNQIVPITDEHELREIETSIEHARQSNLATVVEHLSSALDKLADRQKPDFRNSIKESISAVEALAKKISGKPKADLNDALKSLETKVPIHPALKKAFQSIYAYTSDSDGIRHALMEESNLGFEDAKYMLVSCAAFINYLIVKSQKAGLSL